MIKIVIADTQYLIRIGLKNLLSGEVEFKIIGEALNSEELYHLVNNHKPDVVIFDYNNAKNFVIEDIGMVKSVSPNTNFLIISSDDNKANIYKVIELGALSFLTKECDKEEIIDAVYATAKNEKFLCHKVIDIIIEKHIY